MHNDVPPGKTLLVIDDDPFVRIKVKLAAPPNCEVLSASDGLSGLDIARRQLALGRLDLVVLDIQLPDLEGRHVCAQLRRLSERVQILPLTKMKSAARFLTAF